MKRCLNLTTLPHRSNFDDLCKRYNAQAQNERHAFYMYVLPYAILHHVCDPFRTKNVKSFPQTTNLSFTLKSISIFHLCTTWLRKAIPVSERSELVAFNNNVVFVLEPSQCVFTSVVGVYIHVSLSQHSEKKV